MDKSSKSKETESQVPPQVEKPPAILETGQNQNQNQGQGWFVPLIEENENAIFTLDSEGCFTYLNRAAGHLFDRPPERLLGRIVWEEFPGLRNSEFESLCRKVASERNQGQLESFAFLAKGESGVEVFYIPAGGGLVIQLKPRNDLEKVKEQILVDRARFRQVVENIKDYAIFIVDGEERIKTWNEGAQKIMGYRAEEIIEESIEKFYTQEDITKGLPRELLTIARTTGHYDGEGWRVRKDGSRFWASIVITPLYTRGSEGKGEAPSGFIKITRDLTDLKIAEEALLKTQQQLLNSQKLESIGRLAGGIAHDFNNLLMAIMGYSELVGLSIDKSTEAYDYLKEIKNATNRAAELVRQLLIFSRQQVHRPQLMVLSDVVENMDNLLRRLLGEDVELQVEVAAAKGQIFADPAQIEQVIMNLALNAKDAMIAGGRLKIEISDVQVEDGHYKAIGPAKNKPGPYVLLSFSDTGSGMDRQTQQRIFEPFFTTKEIGKGSGLGLAMVYGIVEQSGGFIEVNSEPGKGSVFKLYFPGVDAVPSLAGDSGPGFTSSLSQGISHSWEENPGAESNSAPLTQRPAASNVTVPSHSDEETLGQDDKEVAKENAEYTILVVEDEPSVRTLINKTLSQASFNVLSVSNGLEALVLLAQTSALHPVDLVITDLVMPKMGGLELIDKLRIYRPEIKIICISGYVFQPLNSEQPGALFDTYLQKPFTPALLLEKVQAILNLHK
ncbi:MAG: PAS domain S-box protein [Chloroflexi bacterium]|nr:PAS domain S-box protein [Chloroflexota bacterium]OJW01850.1 MAG: hypothetical protein BGO39_28270 [Chloroflexi bacterium 54-19]